MTRKKTSYNRKRSKVKRKNIKGGANALLVSQPENNLLEQISLEIVRENNDRLDRTNQLRDEILRYLIDIERIINQILQDYYTSHDEIELLFAYLQALHNRGVGINGNNTMPVEEVREILTRILFRLQEIGIDEIMTQPFQDLIQLIDDNMLQLNELQDAVNGVNQIEGNF